MAMELRECLYDELCRIRLIDPHTHIDAHAPAATSLADILGYHYYTELAHSAGMPKDEIEPPASDPKERVSRLVGRLGALENTVQYSWLIEMLREFFGFDEERLTVNNWEALYDRSAAQMREPDWPDRVLRHSRLDAVFLTNDFDDPLARFDTARYIPCLRTDELVFHLARRAVRDRLEAASSVSIGDLATLRQAIGQRFEHFTRRGARACAISLPPDFTPRRVEGAEAEAAFRAVLAQGEAASAAEKAQLGLAVFWIIAEQCAEHRLPFDLMIGVNRGVYAGGVYQGQDLFDSRVSLIQYRELLNALPEVTFPISVLASVTNQELVAYGWIFPNVVTHGHWWYSNTPSTIEHDAAARLEAVPWNKQIAYYSDMYKLEFALPKFNMYRRVLAKILAERFVIDRRWSEERALALGRQVLRGNVEEIFGIHDVLHRGDTEV